MKILNKFLFSLLKKNAFIMCISWSLSHHFIFPSQPKIQDIRSARYLLVGHGDPWSLGPRWLANSAGSSDKGTLPWLGWAPHPPSPLAPRAGTLPQVLQHRVPRQAEHTWGTDTSQVADGDSRHEITAFPRKPDQLKHKWLAENSVVLYLQNYF